MHPDLRLLDQLDKIDRRTHAKRLLSIPRRLQSLNMNDTIALLGRLYRQFNARRIEDLLAMLDEDVVWANGMEGGHVVGRDGVKDYWMRQWARIHATVEPTRFSPGADGAVVVLVHQMVRDLAGKLLADRMVGHRFQVENGLVKRFDILAS